MPTRRPRPRRRMGRPGVHPDQRAAVVARYHAERARDPHGKAAEVAANEFGVSVRAVFRWAQKARAEATHAR